MSSSTGFGSMQRPSIPSSTGSRNLLKTYTLSGNGNAVGLQVNVVKGPLFIKFTVDPTNDCLQDPKSCRGTGTITGQPPMDDHNRTEQPDGGDRQLRTDTAASSALIPVMNNFPILAIYRPLSMVNKQYFRLNTGSAIYCDIPGGSVPYNRRRELSRCYNLYHYRHGAGVRWRIPKTPQILLRHRPRFNGDDNVPYTPAFRRQFHLSQRVPL